MVPNNTTVLQKLLLTELIVTGYISDHYLCMLHLPTVNQRNPIPVYFAKSEQIVHRNMLARQLRPLN